MTDEKFPHEDELEGRQDAALYPVGRALRNTFDADNHDSLGTDMTGLMLQLARVDPDALPLPRGEMPRGTAVSPAARPPGSWWRVAIGRLRAR